jgi:hypothetical protein
MSNLIYIAFAALAGGIAVALLGWLDSHEPFNPRKFGGSAVRAFVAGIVFATSYHAVPIINTLDIFFAFLGGAGIDVLGNRIAGSLGNGSFPVPQNNIPKQKVIKMPEQKIVIARPPVIAVGETIATLATPPPVFGSFEFWEALGYGDERAMLFERQYKEKAQLEVSVKGLLKMEADKVIRLYNAQKFVDSLGGATTLGSSYPYILSYEEYIARYPKYKKSKVEYYAERLPNEPPVNTELAPTFELREWQGETWAIAGWQAIKVRLPTED